MFIARQHQQQRVRKSYRWVLGAAGEGNAALFPTGISIGAVKVDVQVPVICSESPTALPLQPGTNTAVNRTPHYQSFKVVQGRVRREKWTLLATSLK